MCTYKDDERVDINRQYVSNYKVTAQYINIKCRNVGTHAILRIVSIETGVLCDVLCSPRLKQTSINCFDSVSCDRTMSRLAPIVFNTALQNI